MGGRHTPLPNQFDAHGQMG